MTPCNCQTTGHDPGCPNSVEGLYVIGSDGRPAKTSVGELLREAVGPIITEAIQKSYGRGEADGLRSLSHPEYGFTDVRTCPECGKSDVHWSVSSSLNCRDCRNKKFHEQLKAHQDYIRWVAQTIHQAYHQDQPGGWEVCPKDICASTVRHLLGEYVKS